MLAARLDLGGEAVGERGGEGVEPVEDVDDLLLRLERGDGDFDRGEAIH